MLDLGSVPDWINVIIAFLAFSGFLVVERDRLLGRKGNSPEQPKQSKREYAAGNLQEPSYDENSVALRAELYSRILMGVVLGLALNPIYSWAFSGLVAKENLADYSTVLSAQNSASMVSAIVFSTVLSLVYWQLSPNLLSVFVHWVERLFISFLLFSATQLFTYVPWSNQEQRYVLEKIEYPSFINVIICIVMLLLISFPFTPVDWLIKYQTNREKKIKTK